MERYTFHVRYRKVSTERYVIISAFAVSDDDAIRTAHPLADLAEFEEGSKITIDVYGAGDRPVALIANEIDGQQGSYLERSHTLLLTYRAAKQS